MPLEEVDPSEDLTGDPSCVGTPKAPGTKQTMPVQLFVISTIDWPESWYVVGIASSKEKAETLLRAQNPNLIDWHWGDHEDIFATDPTERIGADKPGWRVAKYDLDVL